MDFVNYLLNDKNISYLFKDFKYGDLLAIGDVVTKYCDDSSGGNKDDFVKLFKISVTMSELLKECRNYKLPISLATKIDEVINEIKTDSL